jgi:hypothetical protein
VVNAVPRPLYPRELPNTYCMEASWAPGSTWTGAGNLSPTGIRSPNRPTHSETLYRLSYRGPQLTSLPLTTHARSKSCIFSYHSSARIFVYTLFDQQIHILSRKDIGKGKAFPLQAWRGSWGSRRLRLKNF